MEKLKKGAYTALGTPLDENGELCADSLKKEINMQIDAGVSGVLLMGSMGIQPAVPDKAYSEAAKAASNAVAGRIPLFIGTMDNSVARVLDRIEAIKDCEYTAAVVTTPFYFVSGENVIVNFFEKIADKSPKPIFLYDLPGVTKIKITYSMLQRLAKHKNIKGIKSGDIVLGRLVKRNIPDFEFLFSNIDAFDTAVSYGLGKVLDGMFSATPVNTKSFIKGINDGNAEDIGKYLDNILYLRDTYLKYGVMPSYTVSMNKLGFSGHFEPDYMGTVSDSEAAEIIKVMKNIGELD